MGRDRVHVALDDHGRVAGPDRLRRPVQPVEHRPLVEDARRGGVDVLWVRPVQGSAPEAGHAPAPVVDREHQAPAEKVAHRAVVVPAQHARPDGVLYVESQRRQVGLELVAAGGAGGRSGTPRRSCGRRRAPSDSRGRGVPPPLPGSSDRSSPPPGFTLKRTSPRSRSPRCCSSTPVFSASVLSASPKSSFSCRITKEKASPPVEQAPKQCQLCRSGLTTNDGVFSEWNGHRALKLRPAFCSGTYPDTTSTMSSLAFMSSTTLMLTR